jgi:hypothetical protein
MLAVTTETSRAETAEALLAPLASPTFTGTPTAPTASTVTNTTQLATTAFVHATLPTSLPPDGSAGGDLTGTYPDPTIVKINNAVTSGEYARGNGSAVVLSVIQVADVPVLNQSTTGNAATATNLAGGATLPDYLAPATGTLTFGSTIPVNAASANAFNLTLTASTGTISNPTNPVDGQVIRFRITQGTGGTFTVTWGTSYDFGTGTAPTLSTTAAKVDIIAFEYISSISKWCCLGSGLGY